MDEKNDILLRQFFSEAAQQTILPVRNMQWFTRIWTAGCILIAGILFYVFHGFELLLVQMEVFLRTTLAEPPQVNPLMVVFALFSLLMIGIYEVISYQRAVK